MNGEAEPVSATRLVLLQVMTPLDANIAGNVLLYDGGGRCGGTANPGTPASPGDGGRTAAEPGRRVSRRGQEEAKEKIAPYRYPGE